MNKTYKKILLIASTSLLLVSCDPFANKTTPVIKKDDVKVSFRRTKDNELTNVNGFKYDENWFTKDSYEYNSDLAELSIALALAGADNSSYDVTNNSGDEYAKKFYNSLSFLESSYYSVGYNKTDNDDVGMTITLKEIIAEDNSEITLLVAGIRGIGYGDGGWQGNVMVGEGLVDKDKVDNTKYHVGFYDAGNFASTEIENYIEKNNIDISKTKVWLSGYSRGAAVANIASINLGDKIDRKNIYTYAIATPTYKVEATQDANLKNIFNIINTSDLVPMIPPKSWNFNVEGTVVELPTITDDNRQSFIEEFYNISGMDYAGLSDYSSISKELVDIIAGFFPTRKIYVNELEDVLKSVFKKDANGNNDFLYINSILNCEGTNKDAIDVETLISLFSGVDLSDINKIMEIVIELNNTLNKAITYWRAKDSYNDELLNTLEEIINYAIKLFLGGGSELEKQVFSVLKEAITLGSSSPLFLQHFDELYLAKMRS